MMQLLLKIFLFEKGNELNLKRGYIVVSGIIKIIVRRNLKFQRLYQNDYAFIALHLRCTSKSGCKC